MPSPASQGSEQGSASDPKISVVIPSYNQAAFLEACLESVFTQQYQNTEVILLDGGSKDGSVKIIQKYAERFAYWQSQPDGGQASAISIGFSYATGDLLTWLNSDDILLPDALRRTARAYAATPLADVFYGDHLVVDTAGTVVERYKHPRFYTRLAWLTAPYICQPGTVFTRRIWEKVGGVDTTMHCAFDYDLWYRFMAADACFKHVGGAVAGFRVHVASKGHILVDRYKKEHAILRSRYRTEFGTSWQRRGARLFFVCLQLLNGGYIRTLLFRFLRFQRLHAYQR